MARLLIYLLLAYGAVLLWQRYQQPPQPVAAAPAYQQPLAANPPQAALPKRPKVNVEPQFRCDGRIYCSQMRSREEAEFFLHNCPGTRMDGNNDGVPCERDSRW